MRIVVVTALVASLFVAATARQPVFDDNEVEHRRYRVTVLTVPNSRLQLGPRQYRNAVASGRI